MNPTFRHIDWSACGPGVTRLGHLTLHFWVKSAKVPSWRQLIEIQLNLTSLQYLGKSVRSRGHTYQFFDTAPANDVISLSNTTMPSHKTPLSFTRRTVYTLSFHPSSPTFLLP